MTRSPSIRLVFRILLGVIVGGYLLLMVLFYAFQCSLLYQPTHLPANAKMRPWIVNGELFGYVYGREESAAPRAVWLSMCGNGGQAFAPGYKVPAGESFYILEYPGYGRREGQPTREKINEAASTAYRELRQRFPGTPVGVIGISFGSGPATLLATEPTPPDSMVLIVPFARFELLISRFIWFLPVRMLLTENWDNPKSLHNYRGPVTIYAAERDQVIAREDTLLLAASFPAAKLVWMPVDHYNSGGVMDSVVKLVR